jgi:hypothetical protein
MKVAYIVTFEFSTRPAVTHRGTILGSSGATCVARAARAAQLALRPVAWSSLVVVLLERLPDDDADADELGCSPRL